MDYLYQIRTVLHYFVCCVLFVIIDYNTKTQTNKNVRQSKQFEQLM